MSEDPYFFLRETRLKEYSEILLLIKYYIYGRKIKEIN